MKKKRVKKEPLAPKPDLPAPKEAASKDTIAASDFLKNLIKQGDTPIISETEAKIIKQQAVANIAIENSKLVIADTMMVYDALKRVIAENKYFPFMEATAPNIRRVRMYHDIVGPFIHHQFRDNPHLIFAEPDRFKELLKKPEEYKHQKESGMGASREIIKYANLVEQTPLDLEDEDMKIANHGRIIGNSLTIVRTFSMIHNGLYVHAKSQMGRCIYDLEPLTNTGPDYILNSKDIYHIIALGRIFAKHFDIKSSFSTENTRRIRMLWGRYIFHDGSGIALLEEVAAMMETWKKRHMDLIADLEKFMERQTVEGTVIVWEQKPKDESEKKD